MIKVLMILMFPMLILSQEAPYKPSEEFEVTIDYKFEERPSIDRTKVEYDIPTDERTRKAISGPLPYLKLHLKILKVGEKEVRIRVIDSNGNLVYSRKAAKDTKVSIDVGFIDDVKDKITPHSYTVSFLSDSREVMSRIFMVIMEDGTFLVNEEKRGKF